MDPAGSADPTLGMDVEEVPPQEESEDEAQVTGHGSSHCGTDSVDCPFRVPLTVREEVEAWPMESATMPSTPTFLQRMESPAAAMITLHRDLTLRLENHMSWQAVVFLRMVDDPENLGLRKPEFWYRCKLCRKWLDVTHLQSQIHSSNMQDEPPPSGPGARARDARKMVDMGLDFSMLPEGPVAFEHIDIFEAGNPGKVGVFVYEPLSAEWATAGSSTVRPLREPSVAKPYEHEIVLLLYRMHYSLVYDFSKVSSLRSKNLPAEMQRGTTHWPTCPRCQSNMKTEMALRTHLRK